MSKKTHPAQTLTPAQVIRARRVALADKADIRKFFIKLAALIVLVVTLFECIFGIAVMPDDSMSPRISAGDLILYYRLTDDWSNNEVMVFKKDGTLYVGRIVARGGDTVEITEEATLVVNGSTVLENNIYYSTPQYESDVAYPLTLAEDEYFILCDQRQGATDSRWFGPVSESEVLGKAITVLRRSGL